MTKTKHLTKRKLMFIFMQKMSGQPVTMSELSNSTGFTRQHIYNSLTLLDLAGFIKLDAREAGDRYTWHVTNDESTLKKWAAYTLGKNPKYNDFDNFLNDCYTHLVADYHNIK